MFPVKILLIRDVAPVSAMFIVSSTSSICFFLVCCVCSMLNGWNLLADGPERDRFARFADVATGNSFMGGMKGFVPGIGRLLWGGYTFTVSNFLFCIILVLSSLLLVLIDC